jgi:hypothetical protein
LPTLETLLEGQELNLDVSLKNPDVKLIILKFWLFIQKYKTELILNIETKPRDFVSQFFNISRQTLTNILKEL